MINKLLDLGRNLFCCPSTHWVNLGLGTVISAEVRCEKHRWHFGTKHFSDIGKVTMQQWTEERWCNR